jgi:hypothetical protein
MCIIITVMAESALKGGLTSFTGSVLAGDVVVCVSVEVLVSQE